DLALLVVLDDVWEPEAVDPFGGLGRNCRVVVTTRDARVLIRANANRHDVRLLSSDAARTFLAVASGLPDAASLPPEADAILRHCGHLPLALAAAGALVRTRTFSWSDALLALEEGADDGFDTSWLPDPEQRTLAVVLRVSVDALSPEHKACFLACAAFREDVDIPEAALLMAWSGTVPNDRRARLVAAKLVNRSLLDCDQQRRYRIHDLYFDYLHLLRQ